MALHYRQLKAVYHSGTLTSGYLLFHFASYPSRVRLSSLHSSSEPTFQTATSSQYSRLASILTVSGPSEGTNPADALPTFSERQRFRGVNDDVVRSSRSFAVIVPRGVSLPRFIARLR